MTTRARRCIVGRPGPELDTQVDRAQADGQLTEGDAAELRRFSAFLEEAGPPPPSPHFDKARFSAAYQKHYPVEYEAAIAEYSAQARRRGAEGG